MVRRGRRFESVRGLCKSAGNRRFLAFSFDSTCRRAGLLRSRARFGASSKESGVAGAWVGRGTGWCALDTTDRFTPFDRVAALLRTADGPLLLVLDDAHAADRASLELIGDLAGELAELPRPRGCDVRHGHDLPAALDGLAHHAPDHRLPLRPLTPREVEDFLRRVGALGDTATLRAESGGNRR